MSHALTLARGHKYVSRGTLHVSRSDHALLRRQAGLQGCSVRALVRNWLAGQIQSVVRTRPENWPIGLAVRESVPRPWKPIDFDMSIDERLKVGWYAACLGCSRARLLYTWLKPRLDALAEQTEEHHAA